MAEYKLSYTASEIDAKLGQISNKADKTGWVSNKIIGTDASGNMVTRELYTEDEKQALIQEVIDNIKIVYPDAHVIYGDVGDGNIITIRGDIADGTYTLKYEYEDGTVSEIGTLVVDSTSATYVNWIPLSIDTSGSIFNGTGYMENKRISSSGTVSDLSVSGATNPVFVTGLIPIKQGDILRFKNCYIDPEDIDNSSKYGTAGWSLRVAQYNKINSTVDGGGIGLDAWNNFTTDTTSSFIQDVVLDSRGYVCQFTIKQSTKQYIQLTLACDDGKTPVDAIVTINEEITEASGYTNQIPISTDTDGSIFNGVGWQAQKRVNSSGEVIDNDSTNAFIGEKTSVTGFIPAKTGDVIRGSAGIVTYAGYSNSSRITYFDSSKNLLSYNYLTASDDAGLSNLSIYYDGSFELRIATSNVAFIRISATGIDENAIITVNEKIVDNELSTIPITWAIGTKLSKTDGTVESTGVTNYNASDYIALEDGVTYVLSTTTNTYNTMNVCYYNNDNIMVGYHEYVWKSIEAAIDEGMAHSVVLAVPVGATKLRLRLWETWSVQGDSHQYISLTGITGNEVTNYAAAVYELKRVGGEDYSVYLSNDLGTCYVSLCQTVGSARLCSDSALSVQTPYYPIKVPSGKTKVKVSLPNMTNSLYMCVWGITLSNGAYTRVNNSGWLDVGVYEYTFPTGSEYILVTFRNESYGDIINSDNGYIWSNIKVTWE